MTRDAFKIAVTEAAIDRAEELFRQAWGEPARPAAKQWRARDSSARSMWMHGPDRGKWYDFKSSKGGDVLEFVAVEFCGLSSASDDFPRVLNEAARLCGMAQGERPNLAELEARKKARQENAERAERRKTAYQAATLAKLQERATEVAQSPAEAYLKGRGFLKWPAGPLAHLPPVHRMRGILHGEYHSLVVWAQDDEGRIRGLQRVLICEDGSKARVDTRKPSFGNVKGFPARFPASVEDGPLCVAEGPETALAIWQATGFEVWAVFGADFFAAAPAPIGRKVILCPDCDAPEKPAALAFDRACIELHGRGCDIHIARAPEPESSKRDFADTLQEQGPEAVAKAVNAAVKFTPRDALGRFTGASAIECEPLQMPQFLELPEAQERIRAGIREGLEKAAKHSRAQATVKAHRDTDASGPIPAEMAEAVELAMSPAPVLAIAASPGIGKSRIAREELAKLDLSSLGGDAVFYAPTLKLAEEAAAHALEMGAGWHVTRGRSAKNPETGLPMCARHEEGERAAKVGLRVKPTLCARDTEDGLELCPHYESCPYIQQWKPLGDAQVLRFEASAYLALHDDGSGRKVGLRVIDEAVWQLFMRKADLPLDRWITPRSMSAALPRKKKPTRAQQAKALEAPVDATKAAHDVLRALQEGAGLRSLPYSAEDYARFAALERDSDVLEIGPSASDEAIRAALASYERRDADAGKRAAIWAVLADCAERGLDETQRLRIVRDVPAPGTGEPRHVLRVTYKIEAPRDAPVLLLDADADATLTEAFFPGAEIVRAEVRPKAEVVQVSDRRFTKKTLQKPEARKELVNLVRAEVLRDSLNDGKSVLVIATKSAVQKFFEDAGHSFKDMKQPDVSRYMMATPLHGARWLWFGPAALGLNDWKDFGTAIVIGREELALEELQDMARAIGGDTGEPLSLLPEEPGANYPETMQPVLMADGSGRSVKARVHPDMLCRVLQTQVREFATRQAYERLRLATAPPGKRLVIVCNVPIPGLPVDRLVPWGELAPSRMLAACAEAAQRGGVLRTSAAGLAEDAPENFPSIKAAERWLESVGKGAINPPVPVIDTIITGTGGFNPLSVSFRLAGQRGRPTPALVLVPGDPLKVVENKLGLCSYFELRSGNLSQSGAEVGSNCQRGCACGAVSRWCGRVCAFTRRKPVRKPFPDHLPRERVVVEASTRYGATNWMRRVRQS